MQRSTKLKDQVPLKRCDLVSTMPVVTHCFVPRVLPGAASLLSEVSYTGATERAFRTYDCDLCTSIDVNASRSKFIRTHKHPSFADLRPIPTDSKKNKHETKNEDENHVTQQTSTI